MTNKSYDSSKISISSFKFIDIDQTLKRKYVRLVLLIYKVVFYFVNLQLSHV